MPDPEVVAAWNIMEQILVEARDDWRRKRGDYEDAYKLLGSKGQFSDIWRKVAKLKLAVWDEKPLKGEQPEKIAKEIIPHCLMMIYMLRQESGPGRHSPPRGSAMETFGEQPTQVIKPSQPPSDPTNRP